MLTSWRFHYSQFLTSGGQLILLFAGFHSGSRSVWLACLGLMALFSLFAWAATLRRYRLIRGTPTSHIASAAQGYVELLGTAMPHGAPILGRHSHLPCLWYRYRVERKNHKNQWQTVSTGQSEAPFCLDDGSGRCVVDPAGAEIVTRHQETWRQGNERYTEWTLLPNDPLYVLGEFQTRSGDHGLTHNELVKQVLLEWKADRADLHRRFDLDGNGVLDMQEWLLARQAAKREADRQLTVARAQPDTHFARKPHDGRLYLISNLPPELLARRYLRWAWLHLVFFCVGLGGIAWLLAHPA
ncbi:MAG: hypothetical protein Fur0040_02330 [Sideroxydans sp.]